MPVLKALKLEKRSHRGHAFIAVGIAVALLSVLLWEAVFPGFFSLLWDLFIYNRVPG